MQRHEGDCLVMGVAVTSHHSQNERVAGFGRMPRSLVLHLSLERTHSLWASIST